MKMAIDEITVCPGRREAAAQDALRGPPPGDKGGRGAGGGHDRAKGNNVSCTVQPTLK